MKGALYGHLIDNGCKYLFMLYNCAAYIDNHNKSVNCADNYN